MMRIRKSDDGTLLVPTRVEADGVIGDAVREVTPGDQDYAKYLKEYEREQALIKQRETK